ncbi:hypothetical protein TNCV_685511 [Trichonephila clavipes]|nr:hypothetical protein TNCV_685511 [Trichonephila clavipes]
MAALCRATGWYKRQHLSEETPAKPFLVCVRLRQALNRRFLLGVRTVNSPQSHIVRVYDAGLGKSGVFHSAEWHVGDWLSDGIREAWLMFFIWVVSFKSFLAWLRAKRLLSDWMQGTVNIDSPSSALVAPLNRLIYPQILTRW